jgi:hypothetical protein
METTAKTFQRLERTDGKIAVIWMAEVDMPQVTKENT